MDDAWFFLFPRSDDRGLIEAYRRSNILYLEKLFPRSEDRGLIEALYLVCLFTVEERQENASRPAKAGLNSFCLFFPGSGVPGYFQGVLSGLYSLEIRSTAGATSTPLCAKPVHNGDPGGCTTMNEILLFLRRFSRRGWTKWTQWTKWTG